MHKFLKYAGFQVIINELMLFQAANLRREVRKLFTKTGNLSDFSDKRKSDEFSGFIRSLLCFRRLRFYCVKILNGVQTIFYP